MREHRKREVARDRETCDIERLRERVQRLRVDPVERCEHAVRVIVD